MIGTRKLVAPLLLSCMSVGAHAKDTTAISLQVSGISASGTAIPGKKVTLTAILSGGPFLVMKPDGSGGGVITFKEGGAVIGTAKILETRHTWFTFLDPYCYSQLQLIRSCTFYLSTTAIYALNYTLPKTSGPRNFTAEFSGDDKYAKGSNSETIKARTFYSNVLPIVSLLLNKKDAP